MCAYPNPSHPNRLECVYTSVANLYIPIGRASTYGNQGFYLLIVPWGHSTGPSNDSAFVIW